MKTKLKNVSEAEIEITCEIETAVFEKERPFALKKIGEEVTLPGFRKGHIPENMLAQKFGDALILEEMANLAIDRAYPEILKEHAIHAIGMPTVAVKKLAKGNPFEFTLTFPVMPEIKLPDYKNIAKEIMSVTGDTAVTDEEVSKAENELLKQFATKDADGKEILPELTLEIAQKFGPFATIEEFKTKIRESLNQEKENQARSKKRMQTMEKIADGIKVKLPQILIDGELDRMMNQFRHDIEQMGMKLEDYLKTIKKTPEDMRTEWLPDAEKRAKVQIALTHIAEAEKLEVLKEDLDREVKFFTEQYKDIDAGRATLHLEMMMMNEKVFQFLETQK
jgi:FKBP-type peptidyl-prolyl cis-trans isomerase (trigger factor)